MEEEEKIHDTTGRIKDHLIQRYKEEFFITEFRDSPSSYNHRIDGLLINLHPSRSIFIEAFEIKASRKDWLNELKYPSKSDKIVSHCDKMWLVTVDGIVKLDEIPENWGLKILKGKRLVVLKEAPLLNPLYDRDFIITLGQYVKQEFNRSISSAQAKAYNEAKIDIEKKYDSDYWKKELNIYKERWEKLNKRCDDFEKTTGIRIEYARDEELKTICLLVNAIVDLTKSKNSDWFYFNHALNSVEEQIKIIKGAKKKLESIRLIKLKR